MFGDGFCRTAPVDIHYELFSGSDKIRDCVSVGVVDVTRWMDSMDRVPGVSYRVTKITDTNQQLQ
jgi:hypothetical protein